MPRVLVLGATGTIGRATVQALMQRGHDVVCLVRPTAGVDGRWKKTDIAQRLYGAELRWGDVRDPCAVAEQAIAGGPAFDAVVSCLASRTGAPADAWAIDHQANAHALEAAQQAGVRHMVYLSAICVQKPLLAFQHAKLALEKRLIESGLTYSIVRPTAFFKSLSGQVNRVQQGRPFVMFADGNLTACTPISDRDLGRYIAECITDQRRHNRVLPIGGPGQPITPRQQGEALFALLGRPAQFKLVPVALLDGIIKALGLAGRVIPAAARKADLARIGRYYATESMLVLNPSTGLYDAAATPQAGSDTLFDHYEQLLSGAVVHELGDHAVF
jgi:divinyl chlorophyllide a 8-vinyl-reductase